MESVVSDVVVVGGGPAGATVSTLLAQQGVSVELFEREKFPRFHIGESLIPETYWVLKRLNMLEKMQRSHFVKKYSVQFVNSSGRNSAPFYFWDNKPHECSQTWQVVRSEFDQMMLDNAREHGVRVHEEVRVLEVLFESGRAVGVRLTRTVRSHAVSQPTRTGSVRADSRPLERSVRRETCGPSGVGPDGSFGAAGRAGGASAAHCEPGGVTGAASVNCWTRLLSESVTVSVPRQSTLTPVGFVNWPGPVPRWPTIASRSPAGPNCWTRLLPRSATQRLPAPSSASCAGALSLPSLFPVPPKSSRWSPSGPTTVILLSLSVT